MQSNTSEIKNQPVSFPSFSVENQTFDPITIVHGRYVGHDGFVVPRDFDEFYERFPQHVRNWVDRHVDRSTPKQDAEGWTQDLLIHLSSLPLTSKYREAGKKDIVATFDPVKHYGANEARFRNYINLCLANKFRTMLSKRMKDALCRPGTFFLDAERTAEEPCSVDELCHKHSAHLRTAQKACQKQSHDRAFLQEFLNFVEREDAKALPTIEALMTTGTRGEAAYWLGVAELEFDRLHTRVPHVDSVALTLGNHLYTPLQMVDFVPKMFQNSSSCSGVLCCLQVGKRNEESWVQGPQDANRASMQLAAGEERAPSRFRRADFVANGASSKAGLEQGESWRRIYLVFSHFSK